MFLLLLDYVQLCSKNSFSMAVGFDVITLKIFQIFNGRTYPCLISKLPLPPPPPKKKTLNRDKSQKLEYWYKIGIGLNVPLPYSGWG